MRPLLPFLLFVILSAHLQAQVRIDSLPPQGILLDKGWRWHVGDNPDFAKPDFDDSKWESIDPTKDIMDLNQVHNVTISWFRLAIRPDSSLFQTLIGLRIQQMGASEVYLNGKLVYKFGIISKNPDEIIAYNPSGEIIAPSKIIFAPLNSSPTQVLAIRFALQPHVFYNRFSGRSNPTLKINLTDANETDGNPMTVPISFDITSLDYFKFGIFLFLCGMHFIFYLLYPKRKNNLFISLYSLLAATFYLSHSIVYEYIHSVDLRLKMYILFNLNFVLQNVFILTAVYFLFQHKRDTAYYVIVTMATFGFPISIYNYNYGTLIFHVGTSFLIYIQAMRVALLAIKQKQDGAQIILVGTLSFIIFCAIGSLCAYFLPLTIFWIVVQHISLNIALLSLPIAISIFLSREIAVNYRVLEKQFSEIQFLSAKTIAQEQEKQQILATQNETLEKQVEERTAQLKASQTQLIQKEKLASLGELTAGIAHEIQNPLNFVNNFSELSVDLAQELNEELDKEPIDKEFVKELMGDLTQNQEKINHHGKRASSIVKGMLEHSRMGTGERVLTDLNALCDEYLRLSYHGMKAKNKDFQADYELIADPNLPKINVVPQDMGRVLLNLINNAFYAIRTVESPKVTVTTLHSDKQLIIKVQDNGNGIPADTLPKIFQPFFTTKPTGEGTGLGLSLAYDIVTKGHGGTLEVESVEGEGATFIVRLPL